MLRQPECARILIQSTCGYRIAAAAVLFDERSVLIRENQTVGRRWATRCIWLLAGVSSVLLPLLSARVCVVWCGWFVLTRLRACVMYGMFLCGGACAAFDAAGRKCIRSIAWLGQMHLVVDGSVECASAGMAFDVLVIVFLVQDLDVNFGEPVPAHYALAYIMRLDATCCICYCDDARPTQPVPVVVPYGTAPDVACRTKCAEPSACGHAGGHFADAFSSACV